MLFLCYRSYIYWPFPIASVLKNYTLLRPVKNSCFFQVKNYPYWSFYWPKCRLVFNTEAIENPISKTS